MVLFIFLSLHIQAIELSRRDLLKSTAAVVALTTVPIRSQQTSSYLVDRAAAIASEDRFLNVFLSQDIKERLFPNFSFIEYLELTELQMKATPKLIREADPEWYSAERFKFLETDPHLIKIHSYSAAVHKTNNQWSLLLADVIARVEARIAQKTNLPLAWVEDESIYIRHPENYRPEFEEHQGLTYPRHNGKAYRNRKYPALGLQFIDLFIDELEMEHPYLAHELQWHMYWEICFWGTFDKVLPQDEWRLLYKEPDAPIPNKRLDFLHKHLSRDELWELRQVRLKRSLPQHVADIQSPQPNVNEISIVETNKFGPLFKDSISFSKDVVKNAARLCADLLSKTSFQLDQAHIAIAPLPLEIEVGTVTVEIESAHFHKPPQQDD